MNPLTQLQFQDDIFNSILKYLTLPELELLESHLTENICLKNMIKMTYLKKSSLLTLKNVLVTRYFDTEPFKRLSHFPILPFMARYMGDTHYIDGIRANDLDYPVMIGVDTFYRPFIVIKYYCQEAIFGQDEKEAALNYGKIHCITVFQRYSDDKNKWCKAGIDCYESPLLYEATVTLSKMDQKQLVINIFRMLVNQPISYRYYDELLNREVGKTMKCGLEF